MRTIRLSSRFKRDYKQVLAGEHGKVIQTELPVLLNLLVADAELPSKFRDHQLPGEWKGFRDCYVRPDVVLIYRKPDAESLELARIGSHSALF